MTDEKKGGPRREFDDAEVSRILERAAEQQTAAERGALVRRRGTSLTQLEEIAIEVGIDPRFVRSAAHEVAVRGGEDDASKTLGVPKQINEVRVVSGEIEDAAWGRIVDDLRSTWKSHGIVSQIGDIREWASSANPADGTMAVRIRLEPTGDGDTLIRAEQSLKQLVLLPTIFGATFGSMLVTFLVLGFFLEANPAFFVMSAMFGMLSALSIGIGFAVGGRAADRKENELRAAVDRIERIAGASGDR